MWSMVPTERTAILEKRKSVFFLSRVPTGGISLPFSSFLSRGHFCVTLELINRDFASGGHIAIPTH